MFDTQNRTSRNTMSHLSPVESLEELPVGEDLASRLSALDVDGLDPEERLVVLGAHQRMISHYQALLYADVTAVNDAYVEINDGHVEDAHEATAMELRAALRLTRRGADILVETAWELSHRLPGVCRSLLQGQVDSSRVRVFCQETAHLPEETARRVADELLDDAHRFTTGQLRAKLKKLCIEADPDQAETRYEKAVDDRRVVVDPTDSGAADLLLLNETRTIDQLRTDVALDLSVLPPRMWGEWQRRRR